MTPGYQGNLDEDDFPLHHKNFSNAGFSPGVESGTDERDQTIKAQIEDKLGQYPQLDVSHVHIDVQDGYVSLNGVVNSIDEKSTIEAIVGNIPEALDVANFLRLKESIDSGEGSGIHSAS